MWPRTRVSEAILPTMPVRFATMRGEISLGDDELDHLRGRLKSLEAGRRALELIEASAFAGRAADLPPELRGVVVEVVNFWMNESGVDALPAQIVALRHAFADEFTGSA